MTINIPHWLNPAVMPPADLIDGVAAASNAFAVIEVSIERFVADHADCLGRYYRAASGGSGAPDDVWRAIDEATGYRDLFDRITSLHEMLAFIEKPPSLSDEDLERYRAEHPTPDYVRDYVARKAEAEGQR